MDRTDEELVAEYLAGDEKAFEELTGRHLKTVYSLAYRLVGGRGDAEDIAQEVFLRAWKNLRRYDSRTSRFKTWLLRIARNAAIDHLRKRKHLPLSAFEDEEGQNLLLDNLEDETLRQDEAFAKDQDAQMLSDAVWELSEKHREVLALHYTSHLTFEEIGAVLDESVNTVKSRHRRALAALKKVLAPKWEE